MIPRRSFLAGTGATLVMRPRPAAAEPPPETTRLRLSQVPGICVAPQYVAGELLQAEGFTDVQYVRVEDTNPWAAIGAGDIDVSMAFVAPFLAQVDAGVPIVLLAGVHVGCFELFGTERVRAIRDLKGKRVGVPAMGSAHHVFLSSMAAYVGLDPRRDIDWFAHPIGQTVSVLAEKKVDALVAFPPLAQELRARQIGHVIVNSAADKPWSQYFCCIASGNREFVRRQPVATKRALRAILKATDLCALEPARVARLMVDKGFTREYGYALQTMKEVPYGRWREYHPEDTVRFYALRLHDAGMVKSSPRKLIAQGTDWRFLAELKKELKG